MGVLAKSDRRVGRGFPFGPDGGPQSLAWRLPLDAWLASLAAQVRQVTGIRQAIVGFEVSDEAVESAVDSPADRPDGIVLADGTYLPAGR
jgi:hypothetical protein